MLVPQNILVLCAAMLISLNFVKRVGRLQAHSPRVRPGALLGLLGLLVFLTMSQSGCRSQQQKQASVPAPVIVRPYQRFVPIANGQGSLSFPYWAFDTKTGQLCKSWDWQSNSGASASARLGGNTSNLQGFDAAAAGTQTCQQLWKAYPDDPNPGG